MSKYVHKPTLQLFAPSTDRLQGITVFVTELARQHKGIISIFVNPGNIKTDLNRNAGAMQKLLSKLIFYPAEMDALAQLYAGTAPEADEMNGKYLIPRARIREARLKYL